MLLTMTWSKPIDPEAGWDLFYRHNSNPDSLIYEGSKVPDARSHPFHNFPATGLVQIGLAPVDYIVDASNVQRRVVGEVVVITVLDGVVVNNTDPSLIVNICIDPNGT